MVSYNGQQSDIVLLKDKYDGDAAKIGLDVTAPSDNTPSNPPLSFTDTLFLRVYNREVRGVSACCGSVGNIKYYTHGKKSPIYPEHSPNLQWVGESSDRISINGKRDARLRIVIPREEHFVLACHDTESGETLPDGAFEMDVTIYGDFVDANSQCKPIVPVTKTYLVQLSHSIDRDTRKQIPIMLVRGIEDVSREEISTLLARS